VGVPLSIPKRETQFRGIVAVPGDDERVIDKGRDQAAGRLVIGKLQFVDRLGPRK